MTTLTPLQSLFEGAIFNDVNLFLILVIAIVGVVGGVTRKGSVAAFGSFLVYVHIATETDIEIFNTSIYAIMGLVAVMMAIQLITFSTSDSGGLE